MVRRKRAETVSDADFDETLPRPMARSPIRLLGGATGLRTPPTFNLNVALNVAPQLQNLRSGRILGLQGGPEAPQLQSVALSRGIGSGGFSVERIGRSSLRSTNSRSFTWALPGDQLERRMGARGGESRSFHRQVPSGLQSSACVCSSSPGLPLSSLVDLTAFPDGAWQVYLKRTRHDGNTRDIMPALLSWVQ